MTFVTSLIQAITTGITGLITPIVQGLQEGFTAFLYTTNAENEQVVSDLAIFMFTMLGLSIGVGLVWLCISIFRGRARARV